MAVPGTVFSLDPATGAETVLHMFGGGSDGLLPQDGLIDVKGTLYGTTRAGGKVGGGTVFAVDPDGGAGDGSTAFAGLVEVKGKLYGTTYRGGAEGFGTVFSIDRNTRRERAVYSFCVQQDCTDGMNPEANVIAVDGTLRDQLLRRRHRLLRLWVRHGLRVRPAHRRGEGDLPLHRPDGRRIALGRPHCRERQILRHDAERRRGRLRHGVRAEEVALAPESINYASSNSRGRALAASETIWTAHSAALRNVSYSVGTQRARPDRGGGGGRLDYGTAASWAVAPGRYTFKV
jgi:uncharacterized repeat protein (TIGR03803 family)